MMDKIDVIPIELNGKKYMTWSFRLKNFVEGEGMLGYLAGTQLKPTVDNDSTRLPARSLTWLMRRQLQPRVKIMPRLFNGSSIP